MKDPLINVLAFSISWALSIFVSKLAFNEGAHPMTFLIQGAIVSTVFMALLFLPSKWKEMKQIDVKVYILIILLNALHYGFGATLSNAGFALTSAVNSGFLVKFASVFTVILAALFLSESVTKRKLLILVFMVLGTYLLTTKGEKIVPENGDILIVVATFCWALANVLIKKLLAKYEVSSEIIALLRPLSGLPVIFAGIVFMPMISSSLDETFAVDLLLFDHWLLIIASGVFSALLTIFVNRTLQVASASYMTMMSMLTPVIVTVLAILFLGEGIVLVQIIGALLIILSGILTHISRIAK